MCKYYPLRVGGRASAYEYRGGHKPSVSNSNIYDDARPWAGPCKGGDKADTVPSSTSWEIYALTEETVHNTWRGAGGKGWVLSIRAPGRRNSNVLLGKEDIPVHPSCT